MASTNSPFMDVLPPELRLQIYSYLLVAPIPIKGIIARSFQSEKYNLRTSILRTNKQIYDEAKHVFLGLNTFHITLPLSLSGEVSSTAPGSFEPPIQLKDLPLLRHLEVDLLCYPKALQTPSKSDEKREVETCRRADQYIQGLAFLLGAVEKTILSLKVVADVRPYTSYSADPSIDLDDLDVRQFLTGFYAADRDWRLRGALAGLTIDHVHLVFEFPESFFEFRLETEMLRTKKLVVLAGQVLIARSEVRMRAAVHDIDDGGCSSDPRQVLEHGGKETRMGDIVVSWPLCENENEIGKLI